MLLRRRPLLLQAHGARVRGRGVSMSETSSSRVEGLGKRYRIGGAARTTYRTLRDALVNAAARAARAASGTAARPPAAATELLWALRDVSFDVQAGRGASASSAATAPARARCSRSSRASPSRPRAGSSIDGRVGSLLEVGTGLPPRAHRAREHLPERRHPRHDAGRDRRASSTRSSPSPRSAGSSTRRSSATRAACTCASRSPWRRTSSRRS